MGHDDRRDGHTDMTADGIAPEDEPTQDPGNTQIPAGGENTEEDEA